MKLNLNKEEIGLLYLCVCNELDKKAGMVLDRNDYRHNQLIDLRERIKALAISED